MKNLISLFCSLVVATASTHATDVFIASGENGIYLSQLDEATGKLSPPKHIANFKGGGFLAIHPSGKHLYATARLDKGKGGVIAYAIEKQGSLRETGRASAQGKGLCHIALDKSSRSLLGANYGEGNVVAFPISTHGLLGKLSSQQQHEGSSVNPKRQTKPHAHSIYPGPNNKFAYAPDLGIDKVMIYRLSPTDAKLTPAGFAKTPAGGGPRHMKFGKNGKQAYVLNEMAVSISVYNRHSSDGSLKLRSTVSTLPKGADKGQMACSEIRVSNNGKFIYCANRDLTEQKRDSVSVFKVEENGAINLIQTIHCGVWIPRNIHLSPSGKWLLVAGQKSNNVPVFQIDSSSGKLSATENEISIPRAMCIEFSRLDGR